MEKINRLPQKRLVAFYYLFFIFAAAFVIYFFNGTANDVDSITHYLYAKFAFQHPELYFNHWAKPIFVLLSSPFAQTGFIGMKIFNSLLALFSFYFLYHVCIRLNYPNPHLSILFLLFCPLYFVVIFSAHTEILFAAILLLALNLTMSNREVYAAVLISFLPFVQLEGFIILLLFGIYFPLQKKWIATACLLVGHIVYALAGIFVYNDALWVFSHISTSNVPSVDLDGKFMHYVVQLQYVLGIPLYVLFWVGLLDNVRRIINGSYKINTKNVEFILIFCAFIVFFLVHALVWYLGIFNTMGLKRIFIAVSPLVIIICLQGFNYIAEYLLFNKGLLRVLVRNGMIAYILIFPFTSNPAAINWEKDLSLSPSQMIAQKVGIFINNQYEEEKPRLIYNDNYISEILDVDHFENNERMELTKEHFQFMNSGDILIWDNLHSTSIGKIEKSSLDNNPRLRMLKEFKQIDVKSKIHYVVYEVK